ncbi:hypothetical protein AgCh_031294 [Apium graveolens]
MDTFSPTEIKRVISLLKDKNFATKAYRSILAEWLVEREERRARNKAESEERRRKEMPISRQHSIRPSPINPTPTPIRSTTNGRTKLKITSWTPNSSLFASPVKNTETSTHIQEEERTKEEKNGKKSAKDD